MKISLERRSITFYLWVGLVFMMFWLFHDIVTYPGSYWPRILNNLWRIVLIIFLNYTLFEYSVPFIGKKRKLLIYNILIGLALAFIHLMFYSWGLYAWRGLGVALQAYTPLVVFKTTGSAVANQMSFSVSSIFFFGIIRHIYNYIKLKNTTQQLRIQKQAAELNYLKSQTNPHFLFNTLNNIYSLSRDKSDLAPESIMRLSKMLRFMLYETGGDYIAIEQELKIINDYIALETLRYDESLRINFNNDIEDMKQAVPPLLLIPLVENAFKHGVSETRGKPFVDIHLSVRQRQLTFIVKNSSEAQVNKNVKESIGLSNLRRQLELLYTDYHLSVQQTDGTFTASLKINLGSHV